MNRIFTTIFAFMLGFGMPAFAQTQPNLDQVLQLAEQTEYQLTQWSELANNIMKLGDAPVLLGQCLRDVGRLEPLRNMLRAVGVPGRDGEQDHLFGPRTVVCGHQSRRKFGVALDDAGSAPDLDAPPMGIVDQEQIGLRVFS